MTGQMGVIDRVTVAAFLFAACLCVRAPAQESASDYSSPEATWKTFEAAVRRGDIDEISKCLTAKQRVEFAKQFDGKSEQEIEDIKQQFRDLSAKITNTILDREEKSETEIRLKVKTEFFTDKEKKQKEGEETKWKVFELENGEWKIDNP